MKKEWSLKMSDDLNTIIQKSFEYIENKNYKVAIEMLYPKLVDFPNNIAIILQIAKCYLLMGEVEHSIEYYEKAYEIDCNNIIILDSLIELKIKQEKYNEAFNYAQQYLNCEDKVYATQKYIETLVLMKNYEVIENFIKDVDINIFNSTTLSIIANVYFENIERISNKKQFNYKNAIKYAKKALENDGNNIDAACVLLKCYLEKEQYEDVEKLYSTTEVAHNSQRFIELYAYKKLVTGDYQSAIEFFSKAVELGPDKEDLYYNLSDAYSRIGWLDEAETVIKKALALFEGSLKLRLALAEIYFLKKEIDKVFLILAYVNEKDPNNTLMNLLYTMAYASQENFIKAEEYAQKIDSSLESGFVDYKLATLYYNLGKKEKSFKKIDSAIAKNPENINYLIEKANFLADEKDIDGALSLYKKVLDINKNYVDAYYQMAKIYLLYDNNAEALKYLKIAVEKDFNNPSYLYTLSLLYYKLFEYDKAIETMRFVVSLTPNDAEKYVFLADLYLAKNDIESAKLYYKEALNISPNSFELIRKIAHSFKSYDKFCEAYEYYQRAYRLNSYEYEFALEYFDFLNDNISSYKALKLLYNFAKNTSDVKIKREVKRKFKKQKKENWSRLSFSEKLDLILK